MFCRPAEPFAHEPCQYGDVQAVMQQIVVVALHVVQLRHGSRAVAYIVYVTRRNEAADLVEVQRLVFTRRLEKMLHFSHDRVI